MIELHRFIEICAFMKIQKIIDMSLHKQNHEFTEKIKFLK